MKSINAAMSKNLLLTLLLSLCVATQADTTQAQIAAALSSPPQAAVSAPTHSPVKTTQVASQDFSQKDERYRQLEQAYKLINEKRYAEAAPILETLKRAEPNNVQLRKQLGYIYIQLGRPRDAITEFVNVERLMPGDDEITLQLAYLYDAKGSRSQAKTEFTKALASSNPEVRAKAQQALANLSSAGTRQYFTEIYAAPFYQSRFGNFIAPVDVRNGIILEPKRNFALYSSFRFSRDSRSSGGTAPQIFSDNTVVSAVGVRLRPFAHNNLTLYTEAGISFPLMRSGSAINGKKRGDFRAGAFYADQWGEQDAKPAKLSAPLTLHGDLYLDATFYSRFRNNVIAYAQLRESVRVFALKETSVDAYGRAALVKDTGRDFFNNLGEGGLGIRFTPFRPLGLSLSAEYVRGFYFGIERAGEPNPYRAQYNDFRVSLLFGKYITYGRKD